MEERDECQSEPLPPPHTTTPPSRPASPTHHRLHLGAPPTHEERLEHLRLKYPHRYARRHEPRREEWIGATPFPALDSWLFTGAMMISLLKSFVRLITFHTVLVTGLAVGSTLMCYYLDLHRHAHLPPRRRHHFPHLLRDQLCVPKARALFHYHGLAQVLRHRPLSVPPEERRHREELEREEMDARGREAERSPGREGEEEEVVEQAGGVDEAGRSTRPSTLDWRTRDEHQMAAEVKEDLIRLFKEVKLYLTHKGGLDSLFRIYTLFDELWVKQEDLRKRHEWVRSVISRPAQYHRFMMNDFENLKLIHDFRTASTLRGYGFVFLTIAPVLLGPYFAWYSDNNGLWAGVFISVFTSSLLLTLYKIQEYVEDPFGGPDGINAAMMLEVGHHMF